MDCVDSLSNCVPHQHMRVHACPAHVPATCAATGATSTWSGQKCPILPVHAQVLPAVFLFIGASLHASPAQLGTLTLCRAMVQVSLIRHTSCLQQQQQPWPVAA